MDEKIFSQKEAEFMELDKQTYYLIITAETINKNSKFLEKIYSQMGDILEEMRPFASTSEQREYKWRLLVFKRNIINYLQWSANKEDHNIFAHLLSQFDYFFSQLPKLIKEDNGK